MWRFVSFNHLSVGNSGGTTVEGQKAIRGHALSLEHEQYRVLRPCSQLPLTDHNAILKVAIVAIDKKDCLQKMVGFRGDETRKKFLGRPEIQQFLQVRAKVVYDWLKVLQAVNPYYKDLKVAEVFSDFETEHAQKLESLADDLLDNSLFIGPEDDLLKEAVASAGLTRESEGDGSPSAGIGREGFRYVLVSHPSSIDHHDDVRYVAKSLKDSLEGNWYLGSNKKDTTRGDDEFAGGAGDRDLGSQDTDSTLRSSDFAVPPKQEKTVRFDLSREQQSDGDESVEVEGDVRIPATMGSGSNAKEVEDNDSSGGQQGKGGSNDDSADGPPVVQADLGIVKDLMNEFTQNHQIFYGRHFDLFLFGQGLSGVGSIQPDEARHMLNYYDQRFATNHSFIFLLFNQQQRHAAIRGVHHCVRGQEFHSSYVQKFHGFANEPELIAALDKAIKNPDSADSEKIVGVLKKLLCTGGRAIPYSNQERQYSLNKLRATLHYAGPYNFFVTISPADNHSALLIRMSQGSFLGVKKRFEKATAPRCNNKKSAGDSNDDGRNEDGRSSSTNSSSSGNSSDDDEDKEEYDVCLKVPLIDSAEANGKYSYVERMKYLSSNPVAQARFYCKLIDAVCEELFGIAPYHRTKQNLPPVRRRREGILGRVVAFQFVTEGQDRGSPHAHGLLVTDFSPTWMRYFAEDPVISENLMRRLDSVIQAHWDSCPPDIDPPPDGGVGSDTSNPKAPTTTLFQASCSPRPLPTTPELMDDFMKLACFVLALTNVHKHTATCLSGTAGKFMCRLCYPVHSFSEATKMRQLVLIPTTSDQSNKVPSSSKEEPIVENFQPFEAVKKGGTVRALAR